MTPTSVAYPRPATAWTLVFLLFLASIASTLDRSMMNFLVAPIRRDLHVSDTQIGLLQGLSFSLFYVGVGIPLGLLADKISRKYVLVGGMALWSGATLMCGLAPSYSWMFVWRMLVGCGEASLITCGMPLLSDSFPHGRRGVPISLHQLGGAMAFGMGALLIGYILKAGPAGAFDFLPGAAGAPAWRIAFVLAGLFGMVVVALLALQREPARQGMAIRSTGWRGVGQAFAYLTANGALFGWLFTGFALYSTGLYGVTAWAPTLLTRQFGLGAAAVSATLGLPFLLAGGASALLAGLIIDRAAFRRAKRGKLVVLCALPLVALPAALATLAPNSGVATAMFCASLLTGAMTSIFTLTILSETMPNDMRGFSVSILGLSGGLVGNVAGPLLMGFCTQHLFKQDALIGRSMMLVAVPALLAASLCFLRALRGFRVCLGSPEGGLSEVMARDQGR